jgi:putative toxin-antitoxin system antitoxin component (TIGR02293 family)
MPQTVDRVAEERKGRKRLTPDQRARRYRVTALAERVFGNASKAEHWLSQPKRLLDNKTPLACASSEGGARRVEEMLYQIQHGIVV